MRPARREQGLRMARKVLRVYQGSQPYTVAWEGKRELLKYLLNTRVPCSCHMCGNPRRHFSQRTIQELRADEEMLAQINYVAEDVDLGGACISM